SAIIWAPPSYIARVAPAHPESLGRIFDEWVALVEVRVLVPTRQSHADVHHLDPVLGDHVRRMPQADHHVLWDLPPLDHRISRVAGHAQLGDAPRDEAIAVAVPVGEHRQAVLPVLLSRRIFLVADARSVERRDRVAEALLRAADRATD